MLYNTIKVKEEFNNILQIYMDQYLERGLGFISGSFYFIHVTNG